MEPTIEKSAPLGIVEMAHAPLRYPGNLGNPATFSYPVVYASASSALIERILEREPAVAADYIQQGRELQRRGAKAVLTTCGFNVAFQSAVARGLSVPVGTSSVLLLPLALRLVSPERRVGVITLDERWLEPTLLELSGVDTDDLLRLRIFGLQGTRTWHELRKAQPQLPIEAIGDDLMICVRELIDTTPQLGAILLECSALCPFSPRVRAETGLPVFDFVSLADLVRNAVSETRAYTPQGRATS